MVTILMRLYRFYQSLSKWIRLRPVVGLCLLAGVIYLAMEAGLVGHRHNEGTTIVRCPQQTRLEQIRSSCNHLNKASNPPLPQQLARFLVDDRHKIIYCVVPKAGCTSWKALLVNLSGKADEVHLERIHDNIEYLPNMVKLVGLTWLLKYSPEEINYRLQTYHKFMIVRHPLERLLSAYEDKWLLNYKIYAYRYAQILIRIFPDLPIVNKMVYLSFDRFVDYITGGFPDIRSLKNDSHKKPMIRMLDDMHWSPQVDLCIPCQVDFDYVAKLETMSLDKMDLLKVLNATDLPSLNTRRSMSLKHGHIDYDRMTLDEAMSKLPEELQQRVLEKYRADFQILGYEWSHSTGSSCRYSHRPDNCC